jgi:CheY-like chemotaxis protein
MITPKANEKGIVLYFYAEPSIDKKLIGDPLRLRQVLLNLLSNAVKFTTKGGIVKILATIIGWPQDNITIHFEIKDSGIGMTPEQLDKISQPFMQADTATTRKYGGTGLGLAISKNIIELMGGTLKAESMLGICSKFGFELTFDTQELTEDALEKTLTDSAIYKPQFDGEILICEDNLMNQQVLCEHLERVGLKSDVAEDGKEGFNIVRRRYNKGEKPYDLIFMDIYMPIMDGIEAASLINKINTGTPIIAMTENVMSHDKDLYLNSGMKDCIAKPFRLQELLSCLLKYLPPEKWKTENIADNNLYNEKQKFTRMVNFFNNNKVRYSEITNALNSGDIKQAHRLVHTLKSNAEIIGKIGLQKAAMDMEDLLKDGENLVTQEFLATLETELTAVLNDLEPLVTGKTEPEGPVKPLNEEEVRDLFATLKPLLERNNPECLKYIDAIRRIPGDGPFSTGPLILKLIQQMKNLDFSLALETLNEQMANNRN